MAVHRLVFNQHERRLCFLWTPNYSIRFHVPGEHVWWISRFKPHVNILAKKRR